MTIEIAGRLIGTDHPPFVIAEMSGNHNQNLDRALAIVDAAAQAVRMLSSFRLIPPIRSRLTCVVAVLKLQILIPFGQAKICMSFISKPIRLGNGINPLWIERERMV